MEARNRCALWLKIVIINIKGIQIAQLVQELQRFSWIVGFSLMLKLQQWRVRNNGATPSSFYRDQVQCIFYLCSSHIWSRQSVMQGLSYHRVWPVCPSSFSKSRIFLSISSYSGSAGPLRQSLMCHLAVQRQYIIVNTRIFP